MPKPLVNQPTSAFQIQVPVGVSRCSASHRARERHFESNFHKEPPPTRSSWGLSREKTREPQQADERVTLLLPSAGTVQHAEGAVNPAGATLTQFDTSILLTITLPSIRPNAAAHLTIA